MVTQGSVFRSPNNLLMGAITQVLASQRIEQKTFRLPTPPPHRTIYKGIR